MPHLTDFLDYCATQLRHKLPQKRPPLSAVLQHPYLNHEFVIIHSFLSELPLKNASDKLDFFTSLIDRLRAFDEQNVAVQLADLLLSRMVLLDPTAQLHVIPYVLSTRTDANAQSLFGASVFSQFIIPRILQLFEVHDAQTRLILLEYFAFYVKYMSEADMKDVMLPQLLLGIRDKNDVLVAATLRALAELVPILGAGVVIGRNRSHVFADGRPQVNRDTMSVPVEWMEQRSITPVLSSGTNKQLSLSTTQLDHVDISESFASTSNRSNLMLERLSPDGGEDEKTASDVPDLENDAWSDWDGDQDAVQLHSDDAIVTDLFSDALSNAAIPVKLLPPTSIPTTAKPAPPVEIDFFADMEPVIQATSSLIIADELNGRDEMQSVRQSRLHIQPQTVADEAVANDSPGGWDAEMDGWDDD